MLLSHGAGGDSQAPLMVAVAKAFSEAGYCVLRWDLPFRQAGQRSSPGGSGKRDRDGILLAAKLMRQLAPDVPLYLAGQSYGGRQSSMVAAEDPERGRRTSSAVVSAASARKTRAASNRSLWFTADPRAFRSRHTRSFRHGGRIEGSRQIDPGDRAFASGGRRRPWRAARDCRIDAPMAFSMSTSLAERIDQVEHRIQTAVRPRGPHPRSGHADRSYEEVSRRGHL